VELTARGEKLKKHMKTKQSAYTRRTVIIF